MKLVFIILTLTLLCKNINSQKFKPPSGSDFPGGFDLPDGPFGSDGSDDCEEKSNDDETNADCCVKNHNQDGVLECLYLLLKEIFQN